jgi:hypothetical protein
LKQNNILNIELGDCVIEGLKISANNLLDLPNLPKKIMLYAINSLQDGEKCYQDIEKKTKMARLFNIAITNPRFLLDEKFINLTIPKMSCGEIQRTFEARMRSYSDAVHREKHGQLINSQLYKIPDELYKNNYGFVNKLENLLNDFQIKYECYTPKVKAEMVCAGLTSFILDATAGTGFLKAGHMLKMIAYSDNTYNAQKGLANLSKVSRSVNSLQDVPVSARGVAQNLLEKNQYVNVDYNLPAGKSLKIKPDMLKEGEIYQLVYRPTEVSLKVQGLVTKMKSLPKGESSIISEINGQSSARIIRGTSEVETVAIIGRGHDRVRQFQTGINSETFSPSKVAAKLLEEQGDVTLMLEENKKWIASVRKRGMTVIDLGMGEARDIGPFYKIELLEMQKYTKDLSK